MMVLYFNHRYEVYSYSNTDPLWKHNTLQHALQSSCVWTNYVSYVSKHKICKNNYMQQEPERKTCLLTSTSAMMRLSKKKVYVSEQNVM